MEREGGALREAIRAEASRARQAVAALGDEPVAAALGEAARVLHTRRDRILEVNARDRESAEPRLDAGSLDRLTLTPARLDEIESQLDVMAGLPPLERVIERWTTADGLDVASMRIPVGVVGANFEARPNVAVDVASQLLKSLNGCVLRTGSAATGTVTALVDDVLRPALESVGLPPDAVGLVRSPGHDGAEALVSLPDEIPLVILRGSGPTTASLARAAASHGVAVIAHAEGGGVLYVDRSADGDRAETLIANSLDRLGVCNRLNLLLVHDELAGRLDGFGEVLRQAGVEPRGTPRVCAVASFTPLDVEIGHEWANDPERLRERHRRPRRGRRRGGGACEPRDERARGGDRRRRSARRRRLPRTLPRDGGVLARTDALRGRLRADRRTGDGDQRRMGSRTARARHLPRPLAAAVPGLGRRHAAPVTRPLEPPVVVKLGSSLVVDPEGAPRPGVLADVARELSALVERGAPVCVVSSGAIALGAATAGLDRPACGPQPRAAAGRVGARAVGAAAHLAGGVRAVRASDRADPPHRDRDHRSSVVRQRAQLAACAVRRSCGAGAERERRGRDR